MTVCLQEESFHRQGALPSHCRQLGGKSVSDFKYEIYRSGSLPAQLCILYVCPVRAGGERGRFIVFAVRTFGAAFRRREAQNIRSEIGRGAVAGSKRGNTHFIAASFLFRHGNDDIRFFAVPDSERLVNDV